MLTHSAPDIAPPGVTFVGDLDNAIDAAKAIAGNKYVNILGASVARQCLLSREPLRHPERPPYLMPFEQGRS